MPLEQVGLPYGILDARYLNESANLSDLANAATARDNLGLGSSDAVSFASVSITGGAQDYTFSAIGDDALIAGANTGVDFIVEVQANDNDSTDTVGIEIDAIDSVGMATVEGLFLGWDAPNSRFSINTDIGASATDRDLYLHTHGNAGQLILNTAGGVVASTSFQTPSLTVTSSATFAGATIANLGTVTTADINGGTLDGVSAGSSSPLTYLKVDSITADGSLLTVGENPPNVLTTGIMRGTTNTDYGRIFRFGNNSGNTEFYCNINGSSPTTLGGSARDVFLESSHGGATASLVLASIGTSPSIKFATVDRIFTRLTIAATAVTLGSSVNLNLAGNTLQTGGGSIASSSGVVAVSNNINLAAGQTLRVNGTQVVTSQQSAISAPSGGSTIDAEARTAIGSILTALRNHGLIAT